MQYTYKTNSELYDKIFNSISDIAYIKDCKGKYILANESFIEITNLPDKEVAGKTDFDLFDKTLAKYIQQKDSEVISTKQPLLLQYQISLESGKKALFELEKTPILDDNDKIIGIIGIGRNITNHKKLENSLIESQNHQKAILDTLPFMAWLKDNQSRFLYVNEPFTKLCQTTLENMIGKTDLDFFPKEMAEGYREDDFEVMRLKKKKHVEEMIKTPDGNVWFETYKTPIVNLEGKVIGTTGFARDITERKKIEIIKNEFISVISHELRTPLTSIKGALGLIASGSLNSDVKKINNLAKVADENCNRLIHLINDILDLEKISAGKMNFEFQEYDVAGIIHDSIKLNKAYTDQFNLNLRLLNEAKNTKIKVDKDKFIQVMTNLISNAAKFSNEGSNINIHVSIVKSNVRFSITDYGAGIPEEIRPKIFDRFIQGDSSNTRNQGGTGLGLNICETIIHKMRGSIDFITEENKGSTFFFDLPVVK